MKSLIFIITIILFSFARLTFSESNNTGKVNYIIGTVILTNGNQFELAGGSVWSVKIPGRVRSSYHIVIILNNLLRKGSAFIQGKEINVEHVSGNFTYYNGYYSRVVDEEEKGAVLFTEDGNNWSVPDYERTGTSKWKPPYKVLITSDGLFMLNLEKNERIIVSRMSR